MDATVVCLIDPAPLFFPGGFCDGQPDSPKHSPPSDGMSRDQSSHRHVGAEAQAALVHDP